MTEYEYVGPAILARKLRDATTRRFRGRILRHNVTGQFRFYVNRTAGRKVPKHWPGSEEFTDDFNLQEVEWLGNKPEDV